MTCQLRLQDRCGRGVLRFNVLRSSQVVVEIFGCDAAVAPQETLQLALSAVRCLNVKGVENPLCAGQAKHFVADAHCGCAGWMGAVAIAHRHDITVQDGFDDLTQGIGIVSCVKTFSTSIKLEARIEESS